MTDHQASSASAQAEAAEATSTRSATRSTARSQRCFAKLRNLTVWCCSLYYLLPWIQMDGRQALLFDLPAASSTCSAHALAAGSHLPVGAADHRCPVPLFSPRSPAALVWLCLSADGVDRSVHHHGALVEAAASSR